MEEINYNEVFSKKKKLEQKIRAMCPGIKNTSGIYIMTREESGFKYAYVGQAKRLLNRLVSHLQGFDDWIDKSILKHKLYSAENPHGWKIGCLYFPENELNEKETYYIHLYGNHGYQLRNKTGGSQGVGKLGINENSTKRGFYEGVSYGTRRTITQVKTFFDKYLDFSIKGKPNKVKERKLVEFKEFLETINEENS